MMYTKPADTSTPHNLIITSSTWPTGNSIAAVLDTVRPDVIVNCAAVTDRISGGDVNQNPIFTRNLIQEAANARLDLRRIVVFGSSSEYGKVEPSELPMQESATLRATAGYPLSKMQETQTALQLGEQHGLPVAVARLLTRLAPTCILRI